jgi:hypothetical protein
LPDKQDFKDIIVCFDDFERLSSSMESRKEEVCALMAAISIILPTISVVTSGTSLISDSIKEKSFNAFIIRLITLILFILCLENCSVVMILNEDQLKDNEETLDKRNHLMHL